MRTASGLMLVALGAILAFAVRGHPSWLNIQVIGWVIMLTGVAGMVLPRHGNGWLRRRIVLRRGPGGRPVADRVEDKRYPPYVMLNPGAAVTAGADVPTIGERAVAEWEAAEEAAAPGEPRPAEEVVEEYVEE
jgi:hypothetical protein